MIMDGALKESSNFWERSEAWLSKIEDVINYGVSLLSLFVLFWISASVLSRNLFNYPFQGVYETVGLLMVPIVFLPLSYTQRFQGHVRVDLVLNYFKKRSQALIESFLALICFLCFLTVIQRVVVHAVHLWNVGETDPAAFDMPLYPFYLIGIIGLLLLLARFLLEFVLWIQKYSKGVE